MNPATRRVLETLLAKYVKRLDGAPGTITMRVRVDKGSVEGVGIGVAKS